MRALLVVLLAYLAFLVAGEAIADTGGSMGGGDWGGGGGARSSGGGGYSTGGGGGYSSSSGGGGGYRSSSSGGGGYSSNYESSSSSNDWSSSPGCSNPSSQSRSEGQGCDSKSGAVLITVILLVVCIYILLHILRDTSGIKRSTRNPYLNVEEAPPMLDMTVVRIAIDGRARRFVQKELVRIAKEANTRTAGGRWDMLREVSRILRNLYDAWAYVGAVNYDMRKQHETKRDFDRAVDDARSRFREEVIRNSDGTTQTRKASSHTPRSDEGEGFILVSVIIAARYRLFNIERSANADEIRLALESMSNLRENELVALEVVWQPAEDNDRMSSMELEAKYPRPELLPLPFALVGKTFCTHCAGPFPAELVSCPHCGAPAPGREAA